MTDTDCEPEDETPTADPRLITTKTKDFLGRTMLNIATNATDYLGRASTTGDKDYLGRLLLT